MIKITKETVYILIAIVCVFWILFNVVSPFLGWIINDSFNRRGWRGHSINMHPETDSYISVYDSISGIYKGYTEATSVGEPEYWITVGNETRMCLFMKQCFLDTFNSCLGKDITVNLEQFGQYTCWCSDKSWVVIGIKIN